jgi:hypothetical protein
MSTRIPFEFTDAEEVRKVVLLLCRQALALQSFARRLTGDDLRNFEDQAREVLDIASRIEAAACCNLPKIETGSGTDRSTMNRLPSAGRSPVHGRV